MCSNSTRRRLNTVAPKKAPIKKVNELAQALTLLNKTIAPQPEVREQQLVLEKSRKQLKPSQATAQLAHLLPFENSALLALQLDGSAKPVLVKLFDRSLQVPLLASAGPQVPGSLGVNGTHVFARFAGVKLQPAKTYQFQIVFEDNTFTGASTAAELVGSNNVRSILALCTEGQAALAVLLKAEHKKDSELRKLVANLIELEKRYVSHYVGKVDEIIGGVVEGWVWCPAKPSNRYEVQAWCGERLVGYGMANLWREDLERLKKDDGRLKFEIPLARHLFDGQAHTIQMKIVGQGEPDVSMNFGQPLEFNAPDRFYNAELAANLMGYELDQKIAQAMAEKLKPAAKKDLLQAMPKISFHLSNLEARQARHVAQTLLASIGENSFVDAKLAESFMLEGNLEEAAILYRRVCDSAPKFMWGHWGLAKCLAQANQHEAALQAANKVLEISPNHPEARALCTDLQIKVINLQGDKQLTANQIRVLLDNSLRNLLEAPEDALLYEEINKLQMQITPAPEGRFLPEEFTPLEAVQLRNARILLQAHMAQMAQVR